MRAKKQARSDLTEIQEIHRIRGQLTCTRRVNRLWKTTINFKTVDENDERKKQDLSFYKHNNEIYIDVVSNLHNIEIKL